eukprot:COSAG06_NODE_24998_length_647_cov_6.048257_1_plen_59_part_01
MIVDKKMTEWREQKTAAVLCFRTEADLQVRSLPAAERNAFFTQPFRMFVLSLSWYIDRR